MSSRQSLADRMGASLKALESEAIFILREAVAAAQRPVLLFSAGKDSTVLAHLAYKAFFPALPPMPLLHIDSTWEFREVLAFRDAFARQYGFSLRVHANERGRAAGINPFDHGSTYTHVMRTEALRQALDAGGYDVVIGGARRDEERSRAKERVFSVRNRVHGWDPRHQRPEYARLYNTRVSTGQSLRVFPLSNWTEMDVWLYAYHQRLDLVPLYFASPRPVIERDGILMVVDDPSRMRFRKGETVRDCVVRFRTLGCWPVTGALASTADDLPSVLLETASSRISERAGRAGDREDGGSLEQHKREGYF